MSDWELSAEYQDYLSGRISKRESIEKYHRRKEELEVRKDCEKCMRGCAPRWLFCWPCAGLCFEESKKNGLKWERRGCAASLSGMFYGGITTAISAYYSSSTGLIFGIPMLAIGAFAGIGLCERTFDCCKPSSSSTDVEVSYSAISDQPQRSTSGSSSDTE